MVTKFHARSTIFILRTWFVIVFCVAAYQILSFSFKIKEKTRICKLQSWLNRPLRLKCTKAQAAYLSDLIGLGK